jgi:hypothetical protein
MIDLEARVRHTLVAVATGTDIPPCLHRTSPRSSTPSLGVRAEGSWLAPPQ